MGLTVEELFTKIKEQENEIRYLQRLNEEKDGTIRYCKKEMSRLKRENQLLKGLEVKKDA